MQTFSWKFPGTSKTISRTVSIGKLINYYQKQLVAGKSARGFIFEKTKESKFLICCSQKKKKKNRMTLSQGGLKPDVPNV